MPLKSELFLFNQTKFLTIMKQQISTAVALLLFSSGTNAIKVGGAQMLAAKEHIATLAQTVKESQNVLAQAKGTRGRFDGK